MAITVNGGANTIGGLAVSGIDTAEAVTANSLGNGGIIAVKGVVKTDQMLISTIDTFTDIPSLSITHALANSSNKLLIQYNVSAGVRGGYTGMINLMSDTTAILIGDADSSVVRCSNQMCGPYYDYGQLSYVQTYLYAPGDTSSHVYHLEVQTAYSTNLYINRNYTWNNSLNEYGAAASTMTLMEVVA